MASKEWRMKQKETLAGVRASFFARCISCATTDRCKRFKIDAHHYLPSTKVHEPSDLFRKLYPLRVVLKELLKCIPLCTRCHVKIHERRIIPMKAIFNFTRTFLMGVIEEHGADYLDFLPGYQRVEPQSWMWSGISVWDHNHYMLGGLLDRHLENMAALARNEPGDFQIVWEVYRGDMSLLGVLSRPT